MKLTETIQLAVDVVGSQRELARLMGFKEPVLSGYKQGRPCSFKQHAQIAAVAGLHERATRILMEGMAAELSEELPHEAAAKAGIVAMLQAFPPQDDSAEAVSKSKPKARRSTRHG